MSTTAVVEPRTSGGRGAPGGRTATSVLAVVVRCEWRLLRRDPGWWVSVALLLGCVAYALHNGRAWRDERARALAEARRDEDRRLKSLTGLLGRIERGAAKTPDAPYRDPGNALYVGRGQGATVAHLPDAPLAVTAVGLSDIYPHALKVSAGSKDTFLFADEVENPAHLLAGGFDLAFVLVYLLPLMILALCYNVLSGEREAGTLALTASSSAPLGTVLAGKLLVRAGGVAAAAVVGVWAALALGGDVRPALSTAGLAALAALSLAVAAYSAFWAGLALLINSYRRDSAFNAVALVMAWVVLLLVVPAGINAAAQALFPAPARAEMVLAVREAAVDAERDAEAAEARYRAEHPDEPKSGAPAGGDRTRRTLEVTLAADARADAVLAEQEARVRAQRRLADRLALLAPPALVNDALAELAGAGHTRWDDYLERVGAFHKTWQGFFVEKASRGAALTTADYGRFPRFPAGDVGPWVGPASARRVAVSLGWVAAVSAALFALAARRLSGVV
ncbi:MAG: ABC transporter permease subunit [Isosphaeraceae bacterium]